VENELKCALKQGYAMRVPSLCCRAAGSTFHRWPRAIQTQHSFIYLTCFSPRGLPFWSYSECKFLSSGPCDPTYRSEGTPSPQSVQQDWPQPCLPVPLRAGKLRPHWSSWQGWVSSAPWEGGWGLPSYSVVPLRASPPWGKASLSV
jgi:hypothetical protein